MDLGEIRVIKSQMVERLHLTEKEIERQIYICHFAAERCCGWTEATGLGGISFEGNIPYEERLKLYFNLILEKRMGFDPRITAAYLRRTWWMGIFIHPTQWDILAEIGYSF